MKMARYCKYSLWADRQIIRSSSNLERLKGELFDQMQKQSKVAWGIIDNKTNTFVLFI